MPNYEKNLQVNYLTEKDQFTLFERGPTRTYTLTLIERHSACLKHTSSFWEGHPYLSEKDLSANATETRSHAGASPDLHSPGLDSAPPTLRPRVNLDHVFIVKIMHIFNILWRTLAVIQLLYLQNSLGVYLVNNKKNFFSNSTSVRCRIFVKQLVGMLWEITVSENEWIDVKI